MSKPDTRIPGRTFHDGPSGLNSKVKINNNKPSTCVPNMVDLQAFLFCIPDNTEGSAILDASTWVLKFGLSINLGACLLGKSFQVNLEASSR